MLSARCRQSVVAFICAVAIGLAQPVAGQASAAAADPDVMGAERLFSAWMDGQIAYRGLPGVAVGVVADQELVWAKGFGFADIARKVPMSAQTKFRMASHSKVFTATAIMQLREEGKLRLDDPVSKYLPWFNVKPAGPDDGEITIEQLLTHSSGLSREFSAHWSTNEFPSAAEIEKGIADRQAAFPPATRWKYSNLAYTIAGMVVEKVSGQTWASYLDQHVFAPLAMRASSVDRREDGLAVGYGRRMPDGSRAIIPFIDARAMASATGLTSTVEDMAKFVSAQFRTGKRGGTQILSTGSLREMHRVRSLDNTWTSGTGLGFGVNRYRDKVYVGHGGGYLGYTTNTLIQLDDRVAVIVLTNTNDSDPGDIARQLMNTVGQAVAKATAKKPTVVAWDPSWARFAGLYRGAWGDQQIVALKDRLVMISPNGGSLDSPTALEALGGGRFRLTANTGGGAVGEIVRFDEVNGTVTRLWVGDGFTDRVRQ